MDSRQRNRLVNLLKEAGWGTREAKCYCKLVELGPAKASQIAYEIDIRKAKVYEPLKKLEDKGYVKIRDKNPKVYMAQNPRYVVNMENEKMRQRSKEILESLEEAWEIQEETFGEENVAEVLRGRDGKETELHSMIDNAEETLLGADLRQIRSTRKIQEKIREKAEKVKIRLIGRPRFADLLRTFQEAGVEAKILSESAKFSYYVADGERVLLSIHNEKTTIVFEEEQVASIFTDNFEDLFRKAEDLEDNA